MSEPKFQMSINLQVLNHLGLNLYSNTSAVLSEVVANAWDADATEVNIQIDGDTISITDNGIGMNLADINNKYLTVDCKCKLNKIYQATISVEYTLSRKVSNSSSGL